MTTAEALGGTTEFKARMNKNVMKCFLNERTLSHRR
jgi:hypothetical protein